MPNAPLRPCSHAGCKALVVSGACDQHRRTNARAYDATIRQDTPALALAAKIRNSAQWQKLRASHRDLEPFCRDPFGVHGSFSPPARASHHIEPLATRPDLAFEIGNLAGLCTPCHARTEALERDGKPTAHLFAGGPRKLGEGPQNRARMQKTGEIPQKTSIQVGKNCPMGVKKSGATHPTPTTPHNAHFRKIEETGQEVSK